MTKFFCSVLLTALCCASFASRALAQCTSDADCRGGRVCRDGECKAATCTKDVECPSGQLCEAGACRPETGTAPAPALVPAAPGYVERDVTGIPAMWITGLVDFGLTYILTIAVTAAVCEQDCELGIGFSFLPVFGPIVVLATTDAEPYTAPLIVSTVLQLTGVTLFILGLTLTRTERVPIAMTLGDGPEAPQLVVLPSPVGHDGYGASLTLLGW